MRVVVRVLAAVAVFSGGALPALALDKVSLGTNWLAEPEHGGFYQAVATGIYKRYDLDVDIRMGGPQVNHPQLLAAGKVDFIIGSTSFESINYIVSKVPVVTVASMFQKDPQILMAHPGSGNDTLAAMKGKPILISKDGISNYWQFLKVKYGFTDSQIRPYTFNPAPFLADKSSIQQGYITSEPYAVETAGGFKPVVHLLADQGFDSYSTTIETQQKLVAEKPELVQRFVSASIEGWVSYLRDPAPANALIKVANKDMDDGQIAFGVAKLREYGIVDSGDSKTLGVGAMTDKRWKDFFDFGAKAGIFPKDLDYKKAYTLQFVNKKVGMN